MRQMRNRGVRKVKPLTQTAMARRRGSLTGAAALAGRGYPPVKPGPRVLAARHARTAGGAR